MLRKISLVILLTLSLTLIYAQKSITREYKISMIGSPQIIYLIEQENNEYNGYTTSDFYRPRKKFLFLTLRKYKEIQIKTDLSDEIVKTTMQELRSKGIEYLKKCEDDEQCKKQGFLDADNLVFEITDNGKQLKADFQAVYPENTQKTNIEVIPLRRLAQILITSADKIIGIKNEFSKALKKIKPPYCYHCSGISTCCIER